MDHFIDPNNSELPENMLECVNSDKSYSYFYSNYIWHTTNEFLNYRSSSDQRKDNVNVVNDNN